MVWGDLGPEAVAPLCVGRGMRDAGCGMLGGRRWVRLGQKWSRRCAWASWRLGCGRWGVGYAVAPLWTLGRRGFHEMVERNLQMFFLTRSLRWRTAMHILSMHPFIAASFVATVACRTLACTRSSLMSKSSAFSKPALFRRAC